MGGEESAAKNSPQPPVNNFAGARASRQDSDGVVDSLWLSASSVFPPRRARSANDQSSQRLWALSTGPSGGTWPS